MSKVKRLIPAAAAIFAVAVLTGCSGINASHSVSPASFFLPGLIKYEVKPPIAEPTDAPVEQVALLVEPLL